MATPDGPPPNPAPGNRPAARPTSLGRRVLRFFLGLGWGLGLAVGALLAALVGWLHSDDFQRRVTAWTEALIERETGEQATVGAVRVSLLPPAVAMDGVHLFHAETDETIASLERARIPIVLHSGGVGIGRLSLQRPVVHLHVERDGGLREFRNRPRREGPPKPLRRLPFATLEVTDAILRVTYPDGEASLDDLDITPTGTHHAAVTGALSVSFRDLRQEATIRWDDLTLGPDRIALPDVALHTPLVDLDGPVALTLAGPLDLDWTGQLRLDELTPALRAPRAAHGVVDLDVDVHGPPADPTAAVVLHGQRLGFDAPGILTPLLTYELGEAVGSVVARRDRIVVERLDLLWGGPAGKLSVWGEIDPVARHLVDGHAVGSRLSLEHLLRAFDAAPTPWIDMNTDLEVQLSGPLQPLQLQGPFELEVVDLQVANAPIRGPNRSLMLDIPRGRGRGELTLFSDHIVLRVDEVETPRNRGSGVVDIGFKPGGPLDLTATLYQADLRDFQPLNGVALTGRGRASGHFRGKFKEIVLDGMASLSDFSVLGIPYADQIDATLHSPRLKTIELHDARAVRRNTSYHGDFAMGFKPQITMDTDVVIDRGRVEDLVSMFIDLPGMTGDLTGTLSLHGPLNDLDGQQRLALRDVSLWGERFPDGEANGFMDQGRFTLDDLRLRRAGGAEGLVMRGSVERSWALNLELWGAGLALARLDHLAGVPLTGTLGAHAHIRNTLFEPEPDGRLVLTGVRYGNARIDDSVLWFDTRRGVAHYAGNLAGGTVAVDGTLGLWGEQPYALTAALERVPAHVFWPTAADGQPVEAVATGAVRVSGDFGAEWSPVDLVADLTEVSVAWDRHRLTNPTPWHYEQRGARWALTGFGLQGGETDILLSAMGGETLDLAGDGRVDLDLLRAIVPGMERAAGTALIHVDAEGTRPDVEAVVRVEADAELLRYSAIPATFEDARARFRITEDRIEVVSADARVGGGTFSGSGTIDAVDWTPSRYALTGRVEDAQVQWVASLPPATGDATLSFDGPVDALLLSGEVTVDEMSFSDRIDWEDWVVEARDYMLVDEASLDATSYFSMNVAITADQTIDLRNNVADGTASAALRVIGDTARPGLVGEVTVAPGAIAYLQDRQFRLDRGQLQFSDPWTWDPQVDFDLVADIVNQDQNYRVNYLVFGPFSDWRTATRSDPPLPQADVNALLWFGATTDQLEAMGQLPSAVVQATADLVLSDLFLRSEAGALRDELPDFLSPDRIDIATGVNARGEYSAEPRLVVQKRLEELGDAQLSWEMNLLRPEDNYVRIQERIGGVWSFSAWYSTLQRARVLPIGGAYGMDVTATWEIE